MKNGKSRWDKLYERMSEKPDVKRAVGIFNVMSDYMNFYEEWICTCAALNRSAGNPNRRLAGRWNARGLK